MKTIIALATVLLFVSPVFLAAQKSDSVSCFQQPIHKNVIKFNPTPMFLWSMKNVTFSYERILNPKQSIAVTLGYLEFPSLFNDTIGSLLAITSREKYGINVALEYRFYLGKRNSRPIPDGVYLAPFASYYGYHFKNNVDMMHTTLDSAGAVKGNFYIFNVGVELGYQFVFWKRLTLDFVLIGPALSYYGGGVDLSGNINLEKLQEINAEFYDKLKEKYPMIGDIVVNKSFKQNGKLSFLSVGFRYLVQIGFHF
ncbi:MAG: hypothetical protein WCL03_04265 [Bacteroidota bacterium]